MTDEVFICRTYIQNWVSIKLLTSGSVVRINNYNINRLLKYYTYHNRYEFSFFCTTSFQNTFRRTQSKVCIISLRPEIVFLAYENSWFDQFCHCPRFLLHIEFQYQERVCWINNQKRSIVNDVMINLNVRDHSLCCETFR